jgi:hypothetical protein
LESGQECYEKDSDGENVGVENVIRYVVEPEEDPARAGQDRPNIGLGDEPPEDLPVLFSGKVLCVYGSFSHFLPRILRFRLFSNWYRRIQGTDYKLQGIREKE